MLSLKKLFTYWVLTHALLTQNILANETTSTKLESYHHVGLIDLRIPDKDFSEDLLKKREHDLKAHRHAGFATLGLAALSFATAFMAKKEVDDARALRNGRMDASDANKFNIHLITAGATLATYFTTAYLGMNAPKSQSMLDTEATAWHKRLAYIHVPAMILGPIFAFKAYTDYKNGRNPSGIGKLHRPTMMLGSAALLGAYFVQEF